VYQQDLQEKQHGVAGGFEILQRSAGSRKSFCCTWSR